MKKIINKDLEDRINNLDKRVSELENTHPYVFWMEGAHTPSTYCSLCNEDLSNAHHWVCARSDCPLNAHSLTTQETTTV